MATFVNNPARVWLVSSGAHAHLDEDLVPIQRALTDLGLASEVVDWHGELDWARCDLAVLRSTWDYTGHIDAFLARLDEVAAATVLANPLPAVRWNADKRYLVELASLGVPVVPTDVIVPGETPRIPPAAACVVKPTVSAGARDTERYGPDDAARARAHAAHLLGEGRDVIVQPYVAGIDVDGETGLVYLGDELSHAFRKGPILRPGAAFVEGLYREEQIEPRTPSAQEREVAEVVLDALGETSAGVARDELLYARVDLAPGPGGPLLMELELIEPSLFLGTGEGSAARVAAAIARWLP